MNNWKFYQKIAKQLMRPYVEDEDLTGVSVSDKDIPGKGGMIAKGSDNPNDMWYVNAEFFQNNYELTE